MAVILVFKTSQGEVLELPLFGKTVVGRSGSADFQIKDEKISSKHCSFELTRKGEVLFTDLGSTNGSLLNNNSINSTCVKINDQIKIGDTIVRIKPDLLSPIEKKQIGVSSVKFDPGLTIPDLSKIKS